jgi:hypothetical protein
MRTAFQLPTYLSQKSWLQGATDLLQYKYLPLKLNRAKINPKKKKNQIFKLWNNALKGKRAIRIKVGVDRSYIRS